MEELGPGISVVIPTFNEAEKLPTVLRHLRTIGAEKFNVEIIVCDGQSTDGTLSIAKASGSKVIESPTRQRSIQLNLGASIATGEVLYFLHADSLPPVTLFDSIRRHVELGFAFGCFRLKFDNHHWFLRFNCWFTQFSFLPFHYGDQSLFITRDLFERINGFDESLFFMEDLEILKRAEKYGEFIVMRDQIITSARKYETNGIFRLQFTFYFIFFLYKLGWSQTKLKALYLKWIK